MVLTRKQYGFWGKHPVRRYGIHKYVRYRLKTISCTRTHRDVIDTYVHTFETIRNDPWTVPRRNLETICVSAETRFCSRFHESGWRSTFYSTSRIEETFARHANVLCSSNERYLYRMGQNRFSSHSTIVFFNKVSKYKRRQISSILLIKFKFKFTIFVQLCFKKSVKQEI